MCRAYALHIWFFRVLHAGAVSRYKKSASQEKDADFFLIHLPRLRSRRERFVVIKGNSRLFAQGKESDHDRNGNEDQRQTDEHKAGSGG